MDQGDQGCGVNKDAFLCQAEKFVATWADIGKTHRAVRTEKKLINHALRHIGRHMMKARLAGPQGGLCASQISYNLPHPTYEDDEEDNGKLHHSAPQLVCCCRRRSGWR